MNMLAMSGETWQTVGIFLSCIAVIGCTVTILSIWGITTKKITAIEKREFCLNNGGHNWEYESHYCHVQFEYKCSCGAVIEIIRSELNEDQRKALVTLNVLVADKKEEKS